MSALARPGRLGIGDRVRFEDTVHTVVGLQGTQVRLADERGAGMVVQLAYLLAADGFEIVGSPMRRPVPADRALEGVPARAVKEAHWWEGHILEVLFGLPPGAPPDAVPRPGYDPARWPLTRREEVKAAELSALGHAVKASTLKHRRQRYEASGLAGLVDHRTRKQMPRFGRVDERVVAAMRAAIGEAIDASSRTAGYLFWRTEQILEETHGPGVVAMPSRATCYRLFGKLSAGKHTTGSARTRRSLANQPDGPFSEVQVAAPGELMQIDSTPLDVMVLLDDGVPGRVELTGMIDVATRTVTAAVLRPATKSVDASVLLARTVTPEPMRPGWADALRMSRSVLPHTRLLELDARLEHAAAKPVIIPETIVCDHGKVFISRNFRSSCAFLGINFQPAHDGTPTDKPHIEKMLSSVGTLFAQFVAGYTGSSVERRGRAVEDGSLWSLLELQELLDEWLILWQNRPHDGLRDPEHPGRMFTPNEKYACLVEAAGYVPVALSAEDYIELLPARWQAVNSYGIKVNHRTYDGEELNPFRRQPSEVRAHKNRWEIHHDPYDVSRIWIRDHWNGGGWITLFWKHLRRVPMPFGELAWDHTRRALPGATEEELADAVADLLKRARHPPAGSSGDGPVKLSRKDRRVAARTKASPPTARIEPQPEPVDSDTGSNHSQTGDNPGEGSAKVIPMPIFDPFSEADKRW